MKQEHKRISKCQSFRTLLRLIALLFLCYLQVLWPMHGMPKAIEMMLWAVYVGQILILSCRLFGIRMSKLIEALTVFKGISR